MWRMRWPHKWQRKSLRPLRSRHAECVTTLRSRPWARTGMLRVRLSMRCRRAAQRLARMGYAVLVTCVGKRETNHPLATSQFLPANPVRRERHQPEPAASTAAAQQPCHRCRVAGPQPDLGRKRAGTQPEVSWNSAGSELELSQGLLGDRRSTESGRWHSSVERIRGGYCPARLRLQSSCSLAKFRLRSGYGLDRCRLASACSASADGLRHGSKRERADRRQRKERIAGKPAAIPSSWAQCPRRWVPQPLISSQPLICSQPLASGSRVQAASGAGVSHH